MPKLVEVNLEGNSIEGSIPDLSNSTSLQYLLLANNRLTGVVPPFLGFLNNISQVSLENNWLQGPLPAFNKSRAPKLNFTSNGFCLDHPGPCDHRVITLLQVAQTLYYPFLLAQSWRGNNPCQDWNFITCDDKGNIRTVNLTNLNLTGTISLSFKNLTVLEGLYLGGNRLNGSILDILTSLRQLKILDVSNNNLSGSLPPFSKKTIVITTGNAFLQQSHSPKTSLSSTFIIGISAGVGVIVMIFVAISYYCKRHFSRIMLNKETSLDIKEDKIHLLRFASGKDDEDIIKKILFVSLWCIQMNPSDRPKMCKVVEMLQEKLESISLESIISSPIVPLLQHSDASHS
ncbi:hypothetical protein Ahy_B04g071734 [Arachis hypogaea]|uniref:Leucine-rich repeat-containing N-terminal plant-type domain-containing protein n=1 Tax=Arachis hypogaea TaxID=3818 RepID=A0A444ZLI6_ARAHY|nr:hypothetical protein Ahy_B04g071734 [Arachis hypogaea]